MLNLDKKLIGIAAAVIIVIGGALFFVGGSKPEASFDLIRAAVERKDVAEVEKYVDFLSLAESVISAEAFVGKDRISMDDPFTAALINEEKAALSRKFRKFAADGNLMDGVTVSQRSGRTNDDMSGYQNATGFRYWSYVSAGASKKDGGETIVPVTIHDRQVEKDYVLDVVMNKEDSVWRVKGIKNLDAFIETRKDDEKAKIDEINKATLEKIAEALSISNAKMTHFVDSRAIFTQPNKVRITLDLTNKTDKTITKATGRAHIYEEGKDETIQTYRFSLATIKAGREIKPNETFALTDSDTMDKTENLSVKALVENFGSYKQKFEMVSLTYDDGTELKLIRELPRPTE